MGKADKYWHIQMYKPEGKGGIEIDSMKMLQEPYPVIGTGESDALDCIQFKDVENGTIVFVREGNKALALCEIIDKAFRSNELENKYYNTNYRHVKILAWAKDYKQPRPQLFSQGTFKSCKSSTEQYHYIDEWLKYIKIMENLKKYKTQVLSNKNLILSGAPGTGKSYLAKLIAASIIGCDKDELIGSKQFQFVQFHPSYDYTDFVEGLRPYQKEGSNDIGFKLEPGIFYSFCQDALKDKENNYVFVIDEINRGEISKIFGELFFSVEPSYRGPKGNVTTQFANLHKEENEFDKMTTGNKRKIKRKGNFFVPENVFIIATMNDIDRSVENLDFAFRRRFPTEYIKWDDTLDSILETLNISFKEEAKEALTRLNQAIAEEEELGEDYTIGGAYLLHLKDMGDANSSLEAFWNSYLGTIINEYLKGLLSQKELKEMVTSLKDEFLDAKTDEQ